MTKNQSHSEEILELLIKSTFIPLIRKFKFLAKFKTSCYGENYVDDVKFIEFCAKLRNCVLHSGGFYKGKDFEYEFENIRFIFNDNEFLEMKGENNYVFLKLNERITNITLRVFECIKEVKNLKYPDDGF